MNKALKKLMVTSSALLMLASVGATVNVSHSSVHASRLTTLVRQQKHAKRAYSYHMRQANHYRRMIKRLNAEIAKLKHRKPTRKNRRALRKKARKAKKVSDTIRLVTTRTSLLKSESYAQKIVKDGYYSRAADHDYKEAKYYINRAKRNLNKLTSRDKQAMTGQVRDAMNTDNMYFHARSVVLQNIKIQEHARQTGPGHVHYAEY